MCRVGIVGGVGLAGDGMSLQPCDKRDGTLGLTGASAFNGALGLNGALVCQQAWLALAVKQARQLSYGCAVLIEGLSQNLLPEVEGRFNCRVRNGSWC